MCRQTKNKERNKNKEKGTKEKRRNNGKQGWIEDKKLKKKERISRFV